MPDAVVGVALALLAGGLLGALFFGGLWWTVGRGLRSPRPALWFGTSLLLRLALAVTGLVWLAAGDWQRLLACLLGFAAGRLAVSRLVLRATRASPTAGDASCG